MNPERLNFIRARMQQYVDQRQISGAVTVVARHGRIAQFEATGYQDVESKKPMRRDTLFQIQSLTKPVTCAGIMVLVDDGKLSVVDPVEKFLPGFKTVSVDRCAGRIGYACHDTAPARPMDIEDLMMHTSGMQSDLEGSAKSLAQAASMAAKPRLLFDPGTHWNYSNAGYDALGRIIEIVSGEPYDRFLRERIFDPLGMTDTTFSPTAGQVARLATVYDGAHGMLERSPEQFSPAAFPHPAGGLISSAADMLRFNLMMRNGGEWNGRRVLSRPAVTLMTVSHTGDLPAGWVPGVGHGYGYEVVRNAAGMFRYNSIGSFVKGGAYRTYEFVDPEKDLVGVIMLQMTNGGDTFPPINTFLQLSAAAID